MKHAYENNISEVKNYIIKMLSVTIESYIKIDTENNSWREFSKKDYSYKIKNFLLLLMKLDEQIDNVMAMVEELPKNLKVKEIKSRIRKSQKKIVEVKLLK